MYYILECNPPLTDNGEELFSIRNHFEVEGVWDWVSGVRFDVAVPVPIRIDFEPFRGYAGPPQELQDVGIPIMTERLAAALQAASVDNIEFFPAILKNTVTGEEYAYRAYNIVGLISAADMQKSEWQSYDGVLRSDVSFTDLVLDEARIGGALMFRLAENVGAVLVHEKVRKSILASGIDTLKFVKPEDWVQL